MAIDTLSLEQYHALCHGHLSRTRSITVPTDATVDLGTVFVCSSGDQLQDWVDIVSWSHLEPRQTDWNGDGEAMDNGWTRYVFFLEGGISYLNYSPQVQVR
jgi:hypothetical protein